jgi:hypothetical protein
MKKEKCLIRQLNVFMQTSDRQLQSSIASTFKLKYHSNICTILDGHTRMSNTIFSLLRVAGGRYARHTETLKRVSRARDQVLGMRMFL